MASQESRITKIEECQRNMNDTLEEIKQEMRDGFRDIKKDLKETYVRKDIYTTDMNSVKSQLNNSSIFWRTILQTAIGAVIGFLVTYILTRSFA